MISEIHTHEDPILTREEAIEILNTPDDQLDMLIRSIKNFNGFFVKNIKETVSAFIF